MSEDSAGVAVWLDDDFGEIEDWVEDLRTTGMQVDLVDGFRALEAKLHRNLEQGTGSAGRPSISLLIIDIMIDGVNDLSQFFSWVVDGKTAHGYAAGLVFLERVLSPERRHPDDQLFNNFENVPVLLFSNRALNDNERKRFNEVKDRRKAGTKLLEKRRALGLVEVVKETLALD